MDEFAHNLHSIGQIRLFKKGSTILFQGEVPRRAFIVRDGVIRAYTINSSGEELIVSFFCKGDILPLPWLLDTTSNSLFYYDAVSDVRVLTVAKKDFLAYLMNSKKTLRTMLNFLNKQYAALLLRITGLEQARAIEKIAFTLYYLMFRFGVEKSPGVFVVNIKLSQIMVANLVGLTRESTTMNLGTLKDKGIIEYKRSTYIIHKKKLENFIGEDGFRDLII
ncbi:MAG TPA: Crp/Fnr family transcriptional regulator [Candidatus Saccharimonadales bacterium]|nr:Crp/Fnr family transcriptional regulator [Candidatus Saccharimonadales bacterium]